MVKVKICGITNTEDAFNAIRLGANFLGFVVEIKKTKRSLGKEEAKKLFEQVKGNVPLVALTDLTKAKKIAELCTFLNADAIQLVKEGPLEEVVELHYMLPKLKIFKTIHAKSNDSFEKAKAFEKFFDFVVLDSANGKKLGGTGKKANWTVCKKLGEQIEKPVFLAGGLNPENIQEAIGKVKPFGVDVSSGVKKQSNKRKIDLNKLEKFITRAKNA